MRRQGFCGWKNLHSQHNTLPLRFVTTMTNLDSIYNVLQIWVPLNKFPCEKRDVHGDTMHTPAYKHRYSISTSFVFILYAFNLQKCIVKEGLFKALLNGLRVEPSIFDKELICFYIIPCAHLVVKWIFSFFLAVLLRLRFFLVLLLNHLVLGFAAVSLAQQITPILHIFRLVFYSRISIPEWWPCFYLFSSYQT